MHVWIGIYYVHNYSGILLLFSHTIVSYSLRPQGLQHIRPPGTSPSPEVCPSSWPLYQWHHPAISSSDTLFSLCPKSFPASGTFPMSWLFASGDQNTRASASVFPMNIQSWFPLRLTGLISLQSNELSRVFSSTSQRSHQYFGALPSLRFSSHNRMWPLGRPQPWLYGHLSADWCLCFSTHCLSLS